MTAWSASREGDGDSFQGVLIFNIYSSGVEVGEMTNRSLSMGSHVVPDSGGPGEHRGGASLLGDSIWRVPSSQVSWSLHAKEAAAGGGINGGESGLIGGSWVWNDPVAAGLDPRAMPRSLRGACYAKAEPVVGVMHPETHELDADGVYFFRSTARFVPVGAVNRGVSTAGHGWGDPLDRDPDLVLRDVRDEYATTEGALRQYGVVVVGDPLADPEGLRVDDAATARIRDERRAARPGGGAPGHQPRRASDVPTSSVEREDVSGSCPECGAEELQRYPVLSDGGWFEVVKCQACLGTAEKEPWHRLGWVTIDGEGILW
jgi:N-methylhydantoinase B